MQAGFPSQLLEIDRRHVAGQGGEEPHHALDDLDGGLRFFLLCHGRELPVIWRPILHYEIEYNNRNAALGAGFAALSQV
jgi:hypothetical protein